MSKGKTNRPDKPVPKSEMYKISREIEKLVARSMSGQAASGERDTIHYLSRKRAALLGQPPKRRGKVV